MLLIYPLANTNMKAIKLFLSTMVLSLLGTGFMVSSANAEKIVVAKLDDLPRYTYRITVPAAELYDNHEALIELVVSVKRDLLSDLEKYDIRDKTTLKDYYANLGAIAMIEKDWKLYLQYLNKQKQLEEKEASKLTTGLVGNAIARAKMGNSEQYLENVRKLFGASLKTIPYDVAQDNLKSLKGRSEILSENLVLGMVKERFQPQLDKSKGEMSEATARQLVGNAFTLHYFLPVQDIVKTELSALIESHKVDKADIWAARQVEINPGEGKPVVLVVWDSGVDTDIFSKQNKLWVNHDEIPGNGIDDDNNGYTDDVHGIAYSLHYDKEVSLLYPMKKLETSEDVMRQQMKGLTDIQASIDSAEASALKAKLAGMQQDQVKPFIEGISMYGNYSHGTHVAGIVGDGNPNARILVSRITFDYHIIPEKPTVELAEKGARALGENVEYFKKAGVRAVNMSWGGSLAGIESALEAHNAGGSPTERKALARKIYSISDKAFREAIQNAPNILFVTSAGNSDNNVTFEEFYPSSYDYPNIISVGAVDQAGEETSFTSFGKVDIYGNGFEVDSDVPGGHRLKLSGTSMSSPQVLNLVGKMLTLNPDLSVQQLRRLITEGANSSGVGDRKVVLMNQKKSMALMKSMWEK